MSRRDRRARRGGHRACPTARGRRLGHRRRGRAVEGPGRAGARRIGCRHPGPAARTARLGGVRSGAGVWCRGFCERGARGVASPARGTLRGGPLDSHPRLPGRAGPSGRNRPDRRSGGALRPDGGRAGAAAPGGWRTLGCDRRVGPRGRALHRGGARRARLAGGGCGRSAARAGGREARRRPGGLARAAGAQPRSGREGWGGGPARRSC
jgi:hypothetical protein